jgi:acyl-CoA thioesterase FadM
MPTDLMNLFFRLLRVLFSALFARPRTQLTDPHVVRSAVWLGDHDPMGHMTNSRYASFTDLAVMNYLIRTGALAYFRKHGWAPIVQYESISFHRSMRFPEKFEVRTRLVGWHDVYLCFQHDFYAGDRLVAESRMIARALGRKKARITSDAILAAMGLSLSSPPIPAPFQSVLTQMINRDAPPA